MAAVNIWSLTGKHPVTLTHLPVLGDPNCHMLVGFALLRSCAASTMKFIYKVRLDEVRNMILKSKKILKSVTCLKYDSQFGKFQTFTNEDAGDIL